MTLGRVFSLAIGLLAAGGGASSVAAGSNMLFVLDGSNSMWGQVDGTAKIATAKDVLTKLLSDLPTDTKVGLMVYGHRVEGDCGDVELMASVGTQGSDAIMEKINAITPRGKTPISASLQMSGSAFNGMEEENNSVVLISDGVETCGGDPCQTAAALANTNVKVRVHSVGFDVDQAAREQLECIAKVGGGQYFNADSTQDFQEAIAAVQQVAQSDAEPEPAPAPKEPVLFFEDQFDGDDLSENWRIVNPDPDAYIVEDGELLALNSSPSSFQQENLQNLFIFDKALPKGDWIMTAKLNIDFQTGQERVYFGLFKDDKSYLVSEISTIAGDCYGNNLRLVYSPIKSTRGEIVRADHIVWDTQSCKDGVQLGTLSELMVAGQPILLRMEKQKRSYTSAIKLEGLDEPQWISLPALKSLRSPGKPAIGIYQAAQGPGETTIFVDWMKIETLK